MNETSSCFFFSKPSGFGTDYLKICYTVEIGCRLDAAEVFIADRIACSTCFGHHYAHHQELKSIIQVVAVCGISCCGFQVAGLVWS